MLQKQLAVVLGAGAAVALLLLTLSRLPALPLPLPDGDDAAARLAFAMHWLLLPGLALLFGIALVANQRFFVADAIDGGPSKSRLIEVTLRYNTNTVEQTVLAAIAWGGLSLTLAHAQLKLIPAMAVSFLIGRLLFFIGYLIAPVGRALGLGLTAYPSFAALIWLAWRMFA
jgi:hypothetical protein